MFFSVLCLSWFKIKAVIDVSYTVVYASPVYFILKINMHKTVTSNYNAVVLILNFIIVLLLLIVLLVLLVIAMKNSYGDS